MKVSQAHRLRQLERENQSLKKLVADQALRKHLQVWPPSNVD